MARALLGRSAPASTGGAGAPLVAGGAPTTSPASGAAAAPGEAGSGEGSSGADGVGAGPSGGEDQSSSSSSGGGGLYGSGAGQNTVRSAGAELIGTFLLVFAGTAVAVAATLHRPTAGGPYDSLAVALAFGLVLAALVAGLGHVSGCHVNPAITIGLAATRQFPWRYAAVYVVAQLVGAGLGALATWVTFGSAARTVAHLGATAPAAGVSDWRVLVVEVLITFLLVFVVVAVATDDRVPGAVAPLGAGFALAAAVFIAGPVTGGAANPARALGPMIVATTFTSWWTYVVGPLVGGVLAAVTYQRFIGKAQAPG